VEAVHGIEGKVLQVRQLFQMILGYKDVPIKTVDELVTHLMQRLSGKPFINSIREHI
jgi:hypothetical protein